MASSASATHPHSIAFNLGAIALAVALVGLGIGYLIDDAARMSSSRADAARVVTRTLSGRDLEIPLGWFRYDEQPVDAFVKEVDLRFELPLGKGGSPARVDVTLLPRSQARPSASLLDGVYLHQFLPEQLSGPLGLVGKPLKPDEGFAGETVWYDALNPSPFVAKCSQPVAGDGPAQCLRTVYLATGIAAVFTFDDQVLMNWRKFDPLMAEKMARIGAL